LKYKMPTDSNYSEEWMSNRYAVEKENQRIGEENGFDFDAWTGITDTLEDEVISELRWFKGSKQKCSQLIERGNLLVLNWTDQRRLSDGRTACADEVIRGSKAITVYESLRKAATNNRNVFGNFQ